MTLHIPDVNVLVHAWRAESSDHEAARRWIEDAAVDGRSIGLADMVVSGAIRVLTIPVARLGADIHVTLDSVMHLRSAPAVRLVSPGPRHWGIFDSLCRELGATGNQVPDCYLAALAIEKQATFVSRDHFFSRVPGLDWSDLPAV